MTFDLMPTLAAVIYFLGIILHYYHIRMVVELSGYTEDLDMKRLYMRSMIWPVTVTQYLWIGLVGDDDE